MSQETIYICDWCKSPTDEDTMLGEEDYPYNKDFCSYECLLKHHNKWLIHDLEEIRFNAAGEEQLKEIVNLLKEFT